MWKQVAVETFATVVVPFLKQLMEQAQGAGSLPAPEIEVPLVEQEWRPMH